jgi:hypothetical protein
VSYCLYIAIIQKWRTSPIFEGRLLFLEECVNWVRSEMHIFCMMGRHSGLLSRPDAGHAGLCQKVALTACMRKLLTILNAMLKHRTPWQVNTMQHA